MATEDIFTQAASATQGSIPQRQGLTTFGPSAIPMPPALVRFQPPQMQQARPTGGYGSVGERKSAQKEALFHNIASLIKAGGDYIQQKKMRSLSLDLQNLMEAQTGITEAQQILQQDPNNTAAREGLARNTQIINTITSDPKKVKMLQKAFDIDLFGTKGKNKNENMALQQAMKEFAQKRQAGDQSALNPIAQRLMQSQPWRTQLNPQAQVEAEAIKAGLIPKANEVMNAYAKNLDALTKAKSAEDRTAAMREHNQIIKENAKLIAYSRTFAAGKQVEVQTLKNMAAKDRDAVMVEVANIHAAAANRRTEALENIASGHDEVTREKIDSAMKIANDKNKTAEERVKALNDANRIKAGMNYANALAKQMNGLNAYMKNLQTQVQKDQAELDKKGSSFLGYKFGAASDKDAEAMRIRIAANSKMIADIDNQIQELQQRSNALSQIGIDVEKAEEGGSPENAGEFNPENDDSN